MAELNTVPSRSDDLAIEVVVMWGDDPAVADILHVGYVAPDRNFTVGDATDPEGKQVTDYLIDHGQLGLPLLPVVVQGQRGPMLIVPAGSSLRTVSDRGVARSAAQLVVDDALRTSGNKAFPFALPIAKGTSAWLSYRGFTFVVRETTLEHPVATGRAPDWKDQRFTFASVGAHLFLLALFYYAPPASSALAADAVTMRERYLDYTMAPPEVELDPLPEWNEGGGAPAEGAPAPKGEQGTLGEPKATTRSTKTQQASKGTPPTRDELIAAATQATIFGTIKAALPIGEGQFNSVNASGFDANSALASLLATQEGPSFGNGLGIANAGRGGGGNADGTIAGGPLGTIGSGPGGRGGKGGYGIGVGGIGGRKARVPTAISKHVQVVGGLSKETIRRTIQRNLPQIRYCYEQALQSKPDLQGRVAVRFIIGPSGAVQATGIASSDLTDDTVKNCISSAVGRWAFPAPDGSGIVSVTYPFVLEQTP